jgi:glycosyltransferase involved in cell wall biosynthesis
MRIAWLGPVGEGGGGPGLGALLLECVLRQGIHVEFYTTSTREQLPEPLQKYDNLAIAHVRNPWQWGRWYSRTPFRSFISGTIARSLAYNRLAKELIRRNRHQPYDCIFQWSFTELFALGRHLDELPPLIVYPGVHAAGELRWHRRESAYARKSENALKHYVVRTYLTLRSLYQRGQLRKPTLILGLSDRFNQLLAEDYGVDPARTAIVYHPIAAAAPEAAMTDRPHRSSSPSAPVKILFVARISVRKGVEQVVALSHRLDDLHGQVEIQVIGGHTQWSNYTKHLRDLNPRIATYRGQLDHAGMMAAYDAADILIMPSMYEPGGIVVGEALSRGVCVVASDQVGSAEPIDRECCRVYPAGDVEAFEQCVRRLSKDLRGLDSARLRALARDEALRHFDPATIARQLVEILERISVRGDARVSGASARSSSKSYTAARTTVS